jgi:hypothetical protein
VHAPGELASARLKRGAQGTTRCMGGEATGVSFLLVTFLWTSEEKSPAVGQPSTSSL